MKKALTGNLVFIWVFVVFAIGIAFISEVSLGIAALKYTAPVGLMATIIYMIPFNQKAKGIILASIPAIFALILSVIQGGEVKMFYVYILSLVMQSLYLDRKIIIGYGSIMTTALMIMYFISPTLLVNQETQVVEFVICIGALIITCIVLLLLTTIEQEKTLGANEQVANNQEALKGLKTVLKDISLATDSLREKFGSCNGKIETGKEGAQSMIHSMEDLVMNAGATTVTVSNICQSATMSREKFGKIYAIAGYIDQYYKDIIDDVNNSQVNMVNLEQQINKISQTASSNYEIIEQFSKQTEDINNLVDEIANISNQTNLLALDASIEAVRMGGHGEKFASVAEQIRTLSEKNVELLNGIKSITDKLTKPIDVEISEGKEINSINKSLGKIKNSFDLSRKKIQDQLEVAEIIKNEFNIIDNDIHNITVVIEENAVRFEEILIRMGHQMDIINEASELMEEVTVIRDNLDKLVNLQRPN